MPGEEESRIEQERARLIAQLEAERPANTKKAYRSYGERFEQYAEERGIPAGTPEAAAGFLLDMRDQGYARSTLLGPVSGAVMDRLRYQPERGAVAGGQLWKEAKEAVKRSVPEGRVKGRRVLEEGMLQQIAQGANTARRERNVAIYVLMTKAMLRVSELIALRPTDVRVVAVAGANGQADEAVEIFIKKSKTDQAGTGRKVWIARDENKIVDPVAWTKWWLYVRSKAAPTLFHTLNAKPGQQPRPLALNTVTKELREDLQRIGVDKVEEYGSHSFRKTGATQALGAGVPKDLVKLHGRWKSDAIDAYNQPGPAAMLSVSRAIKG